MIAQTVQFMACRAAQLYDAYLGSAEHSVMTGGVQAATFHRSSRGDVARGEVGDELRAFGVAGPDGKIGYSLHATILQLIPGKVIVMSWRNKAWDLALDPRSVTGLPSTVVLTFRDNFAGAEIGLAQVNVPNYMVRIPETGEVGPLSEIVNTHWSLLYWEPMRQHFRAAVP